MNGIDRKTGKSLSGIEHLKQSVNDILTTPKGSRVMRREYGSDLFKLIDRPINSDWLVDAYSAVAEALNRWEPRLKVSKVYAEQVNNGKIEIIIEGKYLPDGSPITIDGIII